MWRTGVEGSVVDSLSTVAIEAVFPTRSEAWEGRVSAHESSDADGGIQLGLLRPAAVGAQEDLQGPAPEGPVVPHPHSHGSERLEGLCEAASTGGGT